MEIFTDTAFNHITKYVTVSIGESRSMVTIP